MRRCWLEAVGVVALFFGVGVIAAVLYDGGQKINPSSLSISESALTGLEALTHAVLAIVVVIALSRLRGLRPADLGLAPRWASRRAYRWQGLGVGLMFIVAVLIVGLLLHFASPSAHYPFLPPTAWNLLYEIPSAINAGVVEELVVVAFFVTALEQARTRPWLIYAVGIVARLSYHVYYGWGVIFFALWAATTIWLFRRTRRITPLIVAHVVYDALGSFFHEVPNPPQAIASLFGLALLVLVIVVIVRAIQIARRGRRATWPAFGARSWA